MNDEIVIDDLDPSGHSESPKEPEKPKEQPIDAKEFRALQKQFEDLKKSNAELSISERYWADRAKGSTAGDDDDLEPEIKPSITPTIKDDRPEKLVDDLTVKGVQALLDRGVLTEEKAAPLFERIAERVARKVSREEVGRTAAKLTTDAELMKDYPELQDQSSKLFQKTSELFKRSVQRDPAKAKDPTALLDAAERAKMALRIEELESGAKADSEETRRQDRIKAQGSDRGRRSVDPDEDDGRLSDDAKDLIARMGIKEEDYIDSRKKLGIAGRRGR